MALLLQLKKRASGLVAVRATLEVAAVGLVLGVAPVDPATVDLTVRAAATGVLGDPVRLARELAAAERAEVDDTAEARPDRGSIADGLTGDRTPVDALTGEPMRAAAADMLAEVGGLEAEADEAVLATLVLLVRRTADGGADGAKLARGAGVRAGVAATLLRGLNLAAAVAEGPDAAAGRVARATGVG